MCLSSRIRSACCVDRITEGLLTGHCRTFLEERVGATAIVAYWFHYRSAPLRQYIRFYVSRIALEEPDATVGEIQGRFDS